MDTTRANTPSFAVFRYEDRKSYVVWNPSDDPDTVTFTDGKSCIVPPKLLKAYSEDEMVSTAVPQKHPKQIHGFLSVTQETDGISITLPSVSYSSTGTVHFYTLNGKLTAMYPFIPQDVKTEKFTYPHLKHHLPRECISSV